MAEIEPAIEAELESLRRTIDGLREQVDALSRAITNARGQIKLTMRAQIRCPGCGAIDLLHAREVLDRGESNWRNPMSVAKKGIIRDKPIGRFEVYVCTGCGLVEWYCDAGHVEPDGERIRALRGVDPSSTGPFR
jgi:hypothetical protein